MALYLSGEKNADKLLESDPFALLIGMVLDQQVPLERAFAAPYLLRERLGGLEVTAIANMDPDRLSATFSEKPALHRFPAAMAERVQLLAKVLVESFNADATRVWSEAKDGKELLRNVRSLPGFGEQKAKIFVALLGKQFGVTSPGWREASKPFGDAKTFFSVADIDSPATLARVRDHKREVKAAAKSAATLTKQAPVKSAPRR